MTQLPLPISPRDFLRQVVPAGMALLPKTCDSPAARAMLVAIALQESRLAHRWQVLQGGGKGPARGLLQFESGTRASRGGVWGVYLHKTSASLLAPVCHARGVALEPGAIWRALARKRQKYLKNEARGYLAVHPQENRKEAEQ